MNTYKLTKKDIKGLTSIAEGYKVIKYDLSTNGDNNFRYGALNENIIGTIWEIDNDLIACKWGLHFSKDPANVFNFHEPLGYNRYFKVKAYKECIDHEDTKSVAKCIEFIEEYDLMQYINIIKNYDRAVHSSNAVHSSYAVSDSDAVSDSKAVSYSDAVSTSNAVHSSSAVRSSNAVSDSFACLKCEAVSKSAFCFKKEGAIYTIFNKEVIKERALEVIEKLRSFCWTPNFESWYDIKGNKEWWAFCFPQLESVDNKTAWSKMPKEMLDYIKGLPEFSQEIFDKITGDIKND